jgi:hypothetical protein
MIPLTQDHTGTSTREADAIRQICAKGLAEPARLWDLLEAQGIAVTPGVIYQTLADLTRARHEPTCKDRGEPAGLTAADVEAVASLAEKAGGVDQLVRFLGVMRGESGEGGCMPPASQD